MDAEDIPKDQTREDTRSMAGVWREVEVKCHRFGIEGGLDVLSLNHQAQVHEYYFLRAIAEDPTEPACIQAVLKLNFRDGCNNQIDDLKVGILSSKKAS